MRERLNQDRRNKINLRFRVHLEQEPTQEKQDYDNKKADQVELNDNAWGLMSGIVRRYYTPADIIKAKYLQDKFQNVDTIAKDSCFHTGYMGVDDEGKDKYIEEHFDFKVDGAIDGEYNEKPNYAYALFRDELKAQDDCNPDINIEMDGKERNPHEQKFQDANDKYLGYYSGSNEISYAKEWNDKYELDLIGSSQCRDRSINCNKDEFIILQTWKQSKGQFVMAHFKWIKTVLEQMKFVKDVVKGYKYLDEAIEFANESGFAITDAEVIRCNSSGLTIYNPKNAAEMLKSMKNKNISRDQKIADRALYEKKDAQSQVVN